MLFKSFFDRRRLILPRPRLVNVIELVKSIEHEDLKKRREALSRFDENLAKAASAVDSLELLGYGYYISSCHIEAVARILVARRCKQAGMHWRHHNAACVCAIIAKLRSVA